MLFPHLFFDLNDFPHRQIFVEDIPVWETLKRLEKYIESLPLGTMQPPIPPSTVLITPESISIGKDTQIDSGVLIQGPHVVIGAHCHIRHGAYIRGPVLIGDRCVIGHGTEIKESILLNGCKIPHFNYVGNSILGNDVHLGAGVICANYRLDHQEIVVRIGKIRYKTGMRKLGGVLGDGSRIGCHSVINPGILLRKKTHVNPLLSVQKSNIKEVSG